MQLLKLSGERLWDAMLVARAARAVSEALRNKHRGRWVRGLKGKAIRNRRKVTKDSVDAKCESQHLVGSSFRRESHLP